MSWLTSAFSSLRAKCATASPAAAHDAPSSSVGSATNDNSQTTNANDSKFANSPGSYEELHNKCKNVQPLLFDGAKLAIQKGLSPHFQVTHSLQLSPVSNSYKFGATYAGMKKLGPQEAYPVLLGEMDIGGNNANAQAIHVFGDRIKARFVAQVMQNKLMAVQSTGYYKTRLSELALTVVNPNITNDTGVLVAQYLRRVTPRLDLGAELQYTALPQIPGGQMTNIAYAARYSGDDWTSAVTVGRHILHCSYWHQVQSDLQVGIEWETGMREGTSVGTVAYQADLPNSGTTFRASLDTNWQVGAVLEKRLGQFPFMLQLSGLLDHKRQMSRFGIGLVIG